MGLEVIQSRGPTDTALTRAPGGVTRNATARSAPPEAGAARTPARSLLTGMRSVSLLAEHPALWREFANGLVHDLSDYLVCAMKAMHGGILPAACRKQHLAVSVKNHDVETP